MKSNLQWVLVVNNDHNIFHKSVSFTLSMFSMQRPVYNNVVSFTYLPQGTSLWSVIDIET